MTARLIRPDGTVYREWQTDRPALALTADRNFPPGWRVEYALIDAQLTGLTDMQTSEFKRALAEQIGQMVLQLVEQQALIEAQAKVIAEKQAEVEQNADR